MPGFGQTTRKDIMDFIFKGTAITGKAINGGGTYWITLHTADPGEDGQTSNEVSTSGTAYAAKATTSSDWTAGSSANPCEVSNSTVQSYAQATGSGFGTVTHAALWNHATNRAAANFVGRGALGASQAVAAGNTFSFPIGSFKIQLSSV
jgi:hypothetical protein